jgi:hypothetical protein
MLKKLAYTLILSFILGVSQASETLVESEHSIPEVQFQNFQNVPVTELCIDNSFVRPESRNTFGLGFRPRPIREVIKFDLDHGRTFTLIRKVQIKNHLIRRYAQRDGVQQLVSQGLYDIPKCEFSAIRQKPELITIKQPTPQQMLALSALFQKGITLAQTQGYPFSQSLFANLRVDKVRSQEQLESLTKTSLKTPQCHNGKIELSPEFIRYLKGPEGHRIYRDVVDLIDMKPEFSDKFFNQIWNNHLNDRELQFRGGEGSGNGRIGFGLSFIGGEGSGNGRKLEQTSTDPLSVNPEGEVQVNIFINPIEFYSLEYTQGLIQRLFGQELKYKDYLLDGEIIPENIIGIECK